MTGATKPVEVEPPRAPRAVAHADGDVVDQRVSDVMDVPELALRLQLSESGVRAAIERGEIPGVIRVGRRIRLSRKVVQRFIDGEASA